MKKPDKITSGPWNFIPHGINHTAEIHDANGCFGTVHRDNAQAIAALPKLLEALEQLEAIGSGGVAMIHETGKPTWSALDKVKCITREALAAAGYTE